MSISTESVLKDFWRQKPRVNSVRTALQLCLNDCDCNAGAICDRAAAMNLSGKFIPDPKTVERFRSDPAHAMRSKRHLTGLTWVTHDILSQKQSPSADVEKCRAELHAYIADLTAKLEPRFIYDGEPESARAKGNPIAKSEIPDVVSLLTLFLGVSPESIKEVSRHFFPDVHFHKLPEKTSERYFNTYRFHSEAGKVVKTFTVIKSPTKHAPFCMFANFFVSEDRKAPRRSEGIIVPMPGFMYFIGSFTGGTGLKIMASERLLRNRPPRLHGLMITFGEDDELTAARFVMIETDKKDHKTAGAKILTLEGAQGEPDLDLDDIRNRIDFQMEKQLFFEGDSSELDQDGLAPLIYQIMSERRPRVIYGDKKIFNPASSKEYTFNAALRALYSKGR